MNIMKTEAYITVRLRVMADVQVEAGGLVCRVLPSAKIDIGPNVGGHYPLGECYSDIQAIAVQELEQAARKLARASDPMKEGM